MCSLNSILFIFLSPKQILPFQTANFDQMNLNSSRFSQLAIILSHVFLCIRQRRRRLSRIVVILCRPRRLIPSDEGKRGGGLKGSAIVAAQLCTHFYELQASLAGLFA